MNLLEAATIVLARITGGNPTTDTRYPVSLVAATVYAAAKGEQGLINYQNGRPLSSMEKDVVTASFTSKVMPVSAAPVKSWPKWLGQVYAASSSPSVDVATIRKVEAAAGLPSFSLIPFGAMRTMHRSSFVGNWRNGYAVYCLADGWIYIANGGVTNLVNCDITVHYNSSEDIDFGACDLSAIDMPCDEFVEMMAIERAIRLFATQYSNTQDTSETNDERKVAK